MEASSFSYGSDKEWAVIFKLILTAKNAEKYSSWENEKKIYFCVIFSNKLNHLKKVDRTWGKRPGQTESDLFYM